MTTCSYRQRNLHQPFMWGRKSSKSSSLLKQTKMSLAAPHSEDEGCELWGRQRGALAFVRLAVPCCYVPAGVLRFSSVKPKCQSSLSFVPIKAAVGRCRPEFAKNMLPPGCRAHLSLLEQGTPSPTQSRGRPALLQLPGMSGRRPERPGAARAGGVPQLLLFVLK